MFIEKLQMFLSLHTIALSVGFSLLPTLKVIKWLKLTNVVLLLFFWYLIYLGKILVLYILT